MGHLYKHIQGHIAGLFRPGLRNAANEATAFRNYANALWRGTRANVIRWKHDLGKAAVAAPQLPET